MDGISSGRSKSYVENWEVAPYYGYVFFFYGRKSFSKGEWVIVYNLLCRVLFTVHSNHYKKLKDRFVRVNGNDDQSMKMYE